jgi:hypothetical protein
MLPMPRLEQTDIYSTWITVKIPLNYLERITAAQRVKMRLGGLNLTLDQIALTKLREFTIKALQTREEQMSHQ